MKITFSKKLNNTIVTSLDGKVFSAQDYITMIKSIKKGDKISVEFIGEINNNQKDIIKKMIDNINNISESQNLKSPYNEQEDNLALIDYGDTIDPEDIPF